MTGRSDASRCSPVGEFSNWKKTPEMNCRIQSMQARM